MTPDIKVIRAAAEAAPTEGIWRYESNGQTVWCDNTYMVADIRGWGHLQYLPNGKALQDATGVHIATANPTAVKWLCDEVERLRKDAARYRFLRDPDTDLDALAATYYPGKEVPSGDELDAAIDAAMEAKP